MPGGEEEGRSHTPLLKENLKAFAVLSEVLLCETMLRARTGTRTHPSPFLSQSPL